MARQPDIHLRQIAKTISNDPALSSKVLRTVNSSYYGLSQSVSTISHALVILGLNSVKTLALGFSLVGNLKQELGEGGEMMRLWRRSIYAAVAARTIAKQANVVESEEVFIGALLQDIGVMAMMQTMRQEYLLLLQEAGDDHRKLAPLERKTFNLDHPAVGAAMAESWKLPPILSAPIRHHEKPDEAPKSLTSMVRAASMGAIAAEMFTAENSKSASDRFFRYCGEWFNIDQASATQAVETINQSTREMARLFDINVGASNDVSQILSDANETLLQLSLESQANASQLETQNLALQQKVGRDSLTGTANREHFSSALETQFEHAGRQTQPISLVFIDADRFKSVNDTYGHLVGDIVLTTLAQILLSNAPDHATVARYGGEEFAIILPGMNRREAAKFAEQTRRTIEQTPIETDEVGELNITVSLGVASFDGVRFFQQAKQLLRAADQAVYAAKASGRNCVRIFTPKAEAEKSS